MDKILALDEQEHFNKVLICFVGSCIWSMMMIQSSIFFLISFVCPILSFTMFKIFFFLWKTFCIVSTGRISISISYTFLVACGNNCRTIGNIFHYLACEIVNWNSSWVYCFFMSYSTLLFMKMIEVNEEVILLCE